MRKFFIALSLIFCQLLCHASVVITEIMPKNISSHLNSDFNFEGWIELYNYGTEDIDVSTLFFSDDINNLFKWQMPYNNDIDANEYILSPNSYKIIYMDKLDQSFHANFKLDADGGTLYIVDGNGNINDLMAYGNSFRNSSIGRKNPIDSELFIFSNPTPGMENDTTSIVLNQVAKPTFYPESGFYFEPQTIEIKCLDSTAAIYYTTDGSEPQPYDSLLYQEPIQINKNTALRAIAVNGKMHRSNISTCSYFFETRQITLPVVSLVTDHEYLYGDSLGILVVGTNGKSVPSGCSAGIPFANYMQDWDRPCNFEYFDLNKQQQLNQEVKIGGFGGCSRTNKTKSIKIKANKTFEDSRLEYPLFKEKNNLQWKSVVLRNSGNDYSSTMLRDGFLQSALIGRMDIDHQAYEPTVVYINGSYYGMLNMRERTNDDFVYSNYGLDEDEIFMHSGSKQYDYSQPTSDYPDMYDFFVNAENMNADGMYDSICAYVDVNELLNYLTAQIYLCNRDWPGGNIKAWKKRTNGKWRWILYDTDFGFSLYEDNRETNSYNYAKSNQLFAAFMKNDLFKFRLMTKMVVHLPTTFSEKRLLNQLDSVISIVESELNYFRYKKGGARDYYGGINKIKSFAKSRVNNLFNLTSEGLGYNDTCSLNILTKTPNVKYRINHFEVADASNLYSKYFENTPISIEAITPAGYKFSHWEISEREPYYSNSYNWKCFDQGEIKDSRWKEVDFDDSNWSDKSGIIGFGYNNICSEINQKEAFSDDIITTAYFRYPLIIDDTTNFGDITLSTTVNDAAIVYLNGKEILRGNLPQGEIAYDCKSSVYFGASIKTYEITLPASAFNNGKNIIAVEVHNHTNTSTTLYFTMDVKTKKEDMIHHTKSTEKIFYDKSFLGGTLIAVFDKEDENIENNDVNLYLNEICISNNTFVDEYRETDDWIEIYNDGWTDVNLAGYYLSDERKNLTKFQIPDTDSIATTIPAKGYKIFWADSQPEQGVLHTNFSLPATRTQTVSLSRVINGDTIVIDSIRYKPHIKGESFARFSQDKTESAWEVTSRPTFNSENPVKTDVPTIIVDENSAMVYPNPVQEKLFINTTIDDCQLIISDFTGRIVLEKRIENHTNLDVTHLKKGVYLLKIYSNSFVHSTRFIKE